MKLKRIIRIALLNLCVVVYAIYWARADSCILMGGACAEPNGSQKGTHEPAVRTPSSSPNTSNDSTIQTSNKPLPADIPFDLDVVQLVETLFANPPPINIASYDVSSSWKSKGAGGPMSSIQDQQTVLQLLRPGITEEKTDSEIWVKNSAGSMTSTMQMSSISGGNGFFTIGSTTVTRNRFGKSTVRSKVIKLENISGNLFPIAVGNHFAYDTVTRYDSVSLGYRSSDVYTMKNSCDVTRQFEAKMFHLELTGVAYLARCDVQTSYKKQPAANSTSQSNVVYFDALGFWIAADPIVEQKIIMNGATSVVGKYRTVTTGSYILRSFFLAR